MAKNDSSSSFGRGVRGLTEIRAQFAVEHGAEHGFYGVSIVIEGWLSSEALAPKSI